MIDSLEHETVLVAFMSGNCGPCKIQKQELATLAQRGESLKMLRIDMNQFPKLGTKFNIGKLPCILVLKNKEVIMRADGLITAQDLWDQVQLLLPQQKKNT
jgi:thiol-disulfide isomerase/thioredoxin